MGHLGTDFLDRLSRRSLRPGELRREANLIPGPRLGERAHLADRRRLARSKASRLERRTFLSGAPWSPQGHELYEEPYVGNHRNQQEAQPCLLHRQPCFHNTHCTICFTLRAGAACASETRCASPPDSGRGRASRGRRQARSHRRWPWRLPRPRPRRPPFATDSRTCGSRLSRRSPCARGANVDGPIHRVAHFELPDGLGDLLLELLGQCVTSGATSSFCSVLPLWPQRCSCFPALPVCVLLLFSRTGRDSGPLA